MKSFLIICKMICTQNPTPYEIFLSEQLSIKLPANAQNMKISPNDLNLKRKFSFTSKNKFKNFLQSLVMRIIISRSNEENAIEDTFNETSLEALSNILTMDNFCRVSQTSSDLMNDKKVQEYDKLVYQRVSIILINLAYFYAQSNRLFKLHYVINCLTSALYYEYNCSFKPLLFCYYIYQLHQVINNDRWTRLTIQLLSYDMEDKELRLTGIYVRDGSHYNANRRFTYLPIVYGRLHNLIDDDRTEFIPHYMKIYAKDVQVEQIYYKDFLIIFLFCYYDDFKQGDIYEMDIKISLKFALEHLKGLIMIQKFVKLKIEDLAILMFLSKITKIYSDFNMIELIQTLNSLIVLIDLNDEANYQIYELYLQIIKNCISEQDSNVSDVFKALLTLFIKFEHLKSKEKIQRAKENFFIDIEIKYDITKLLTNEHVIEFLFYIINGNLELYHKIMSFVKNLKTSVVLNLRQDNVKILNKELFNLMSVKLSEDNYILFIPLMTLIIEKYITSAEDVKYLNETSVLKLCDYNINTCEDVIIMIVNFINIFLIKKIKIALKEDKIQFVKYYEKIQFFITNIDTQYGLLAKKLVVLNAMKYKTNAFIGRIINLIDRNDKNKMIEKLKNFMETLHQAIIDYQAKYNEKSYKKSHPLELLIIFFDEEFLKIAFEIKFVNAREFAEIVRQLHSFIEEQKTLFNNLTTDRSLLSEKCLFLKFTLALLKSK